MPFFIIAPQKQQNPHGGGFKLCGEVTPLHQVFGNKITCGVLVFMPIK